MTMSAAEPPSSRGLRNRTTNRAHAAPIVRSGVYAATWATSLARPGCSGVRMNFETLEPTIPNNAGSRVSEISIAISTDTAAARPM